MRNIYPIPYNEGGLWGYKDIHEITVIQPAYKNAEPFAGNLAKVFNGEYYGLIDIKGDSVLDQKYNKIILREDIAGYEFHLRGKVGFISFDKRIFIKPEFSYIGGISEGLIPAGKGNLYGFLNGIFQEVIPFQYHFVEKFRYGVARVKDSKGNVFLINRKGERIENPRYIYADKAILNSYVEQKIGGAIQYEEALPNGVRVYQHSISPYFTAMIDDKNFLLAKFYDKIFALSDSFIAVEVKQVDPFSEKKVALYGVFDLNGDQVLPPIFEQIEYLGENCFKIKIRGLWGVINTRLEVLLEPVHKEIPDPVGGLINLTAKSNLIVNVNETDTPLSQWLAGRLLDFGFCPALVGNFRAFYDATGSINYHGFEIFTPERINHNDNSGLDEESIKKCKEELESEMISWVRKDSHGTFLLNELLEERSVDDGEDLKNFILSLGVEDESGVELYSLNDLNDPMVWMLSSTWENKNEDDNRSLHDWVFKGLISDRHGRFELAEEVNELFDEIVSHADDPDSVSDDNEDEDEDFRLNIFDEESDDEEEFNIDEDDSDSEDDSTLHKFDEADGFRGGSFIIDEQGIPQFVANKPGVKKWGEGSYILLDIGMRSDQGSIMNSKFEPLDPEIHPFVNDLQKYAGFLRVECRGRFGFVNHLGDLVVDPVYRSLSQFINGKALGITTNSTHIISEELEFIELPLILTNFHSWDGNIASGCISTEEGEKWGVFDFTGKIIIPFEYDFIRHIGEMSFVVKSAGMFGVINANGETVAEIKYVGYSMPIFSILPLKHPGGWFDLFNIKTQKFLNYFNDSCENIPLKPAYVSELGEGYILLGMKRTLGYINLANPTHSRIIKER